MSPQLFDAAAPPLLSVDHLDVAVYDAEAAHRREDHRLTEGPGGRPLPPGWVHVVRDVSFSVNREEVLAFVGESGSGKSLTVMGSLGLLAPGARTIGGSVALLGHRVDLWATALERGRRDTWRERRRRKKRMRAFMGELLDPQWRHLMGMEVGVLFQDAVASWDPTSVIGRQSGEALEAHTDLGREEIEQRVLDALGDVKLPKRGFSAFRHELSRGQAQRAMLAAALVKAPSLLIADEPLSGLDASVASAILDLIDDMRHKRGLGMIIVTHDLATVAAVADRVAVVYGGRIVEEGRVDDIFHRPVHPYTEGLLGSIPVLGGGRLRPIEGSPPKLVEVRHDRCAFAPRCPYAEPRCLDGAPPLAKVHQSRSACIRANELLLRGVGR